MKVKHRREDFVVRERSRYAPSGTGPVAVYRLEKSGIGTPEAIDDMLRQWGVKRADVSYGGMKDRHAVTVQTVTIFAGPTSSLEADKYSLHYLGQARELFTAKDIDANEFQLCLRDLARADAEQLHQKISGGGLLIPNYFDKQRFGSVGDSGQYIALPWCLGDYELALRLALSEFNANDPPPLREQKKIIRDNWGQWQTCKDLLERGNLRSVITYLVDHPVGYKKAAALINRDMRSIYVAAFQAKIWNEILSRLMRSLCPDGNFRGVTTDTGELVFPHQLSEDVVASLAALEIPLPSGRQSKWPAMARPWLDEVLGEFGIPLHKLRFSHPRDVFFSRALRPAVLGCQELKSEVADDDLHADRCKLQLHFRLPPGQYATMLLKGLEIDDVIA